MASTRKWDLPSNMESQPCVRSVMMFLADITGDRIITGQHTQTMAMEELTKIREVTGKKLLFLVSGGLVMSGLLPVLTSNSTCMASGCVVSLSCSVISSEVEHDIIIMPNNR